MGRRVTVLKAEKVRKGGIAGMFSKEHYEVLVEVEGVGEPPEQFSNATTRPARPEPPKHRTLSEQAQDAGFFRKKTVARGRSGDRAAGTAGDSDSTHESETADSEADKKDAGLQNLLDEARTQLNSGTEAAAADLEAQLAAMGIGQPSTPAPSTPTPPSAPPPTPAMGLRQSSPLLDARLQGVAAPGSTGSIGSPLSRSVINHRPSTPQRIPEGLAVELGFPRQILAGMPVDGASEVEIDDFVSALPEPVELLEKPGSTIVVIGAAPIALSVVETAQRLAGRLGDEGYCVLGGPKTTLPGEELRARSAEELHNLMEQHAGKTCVLALADSLIEAHRRTMAKLLSVIYVDQTWAVVDGRTSVDKIQNWLRGLPDALHPDTLAVQRIWEAERPGELFEIGVPIGMLDGVPARGEAWKMLLEDILAS